MLGISFSTQMAVERRLYNLLMLFFFFFEVVCTEKGPEDCSSL